MGCPQHPPLAGDISDALYHTLILQGASRSDAQPVAPQSLPAIWESQASLDTPGRPQNQGVADALTSTWLLLGALLSPGKWPLPSKRHLADKLWRCDGLKAEHEHTLAKGRACTGFIPLCSTQVPSTKSPVAARLMGKPTASLLLFPKELVLPAQPPQRGDLPVDALVIVVSIEELYLLKGL